MGSSLCSLNTETEEFYYEVTEERGNSVKRAFGRRYFLVVPIPGLRGEEITIEIRTKNLYDASADQISINGRFNASHAMRFCFVQLNLASSSSALQAFPFLSLH